MAYLNVKERIIETKVVYYGAGLSGKTTNLELVKKLSSGGQCGDMMSLDTDGDRTLYFDWLPYNLGKVNGCEIKLQLYTVPGQPQYGETRRKVLSGADGVVVVLDSQAGALEKNREILADLREHLKAQKLEAVPIVVQLNKRDLPTAMSVKDLLASVGMSDHPCVEAVASKGEGVFETLQEITKAVLSRVSQAAKAQTGDIKVGDKSALDGDTLYAAVGPASKSTTAPSAKTKASLPGQALHAAPPGSAIRDTLTSADPAFKGAAKPASAASAPEPIPAGASQLNEIVGAQRALSRRLDALEQSLQQSQAIGAAELERRVLQRLGQLMDQERAERHAFFAECKESLVALSQCAARMNESAEGVAAHVTKQVGLFGEAAKAEREETNGLHTKLKHDVITNVVKLEKKLDEKAKQCIDMHFSTGHELFAEKVAELLESRAATIESRVDYALKGHDAQTMAALDALKAEAATATTAAKSSEQRIQAWVEAHTPPRGPEGEKYDTEGKRRPWWHL